MELGATFTLGAVLGAGWIKSIGDAKKDISLFTRMADGLNTKAISMPINIDETRLNRAKEALAIASADLNKLGASTPLKGASEDEKSAHRQKTSKAKSDVAALRKEVNELTTAQDKYTASLTASGLKENAYSKQAAGVAKMAGAMRNLSNATEGFRQSWSNAITLLRNSAVHMTAFVAGQVAFVGSVAKAGEAVRLSAERVGMGVTEYQKLSYVASRSGVSAQQFDASLQHLNHSLGQAAQGSHSAQAVFAKLKITHESFLAMPMDEKLGFIAKKMEGVTSATERAYIAQELFGRGAGAMSEVLKGGSDNMRAMMQAAGGKTYVMTEKEIERSRQFTQTLEDTKQAFAALKTGAGLGIMQSLKGVLENISTWVNANRERITNFLTEFGKKAAAVFGSIFKVVSGVGSLLISFASLPGVATAAVFAFASVGTAVAAIRVGALARDTYVLIRSWIAAAPAVLTYAKTLWVQSAASIKAALANRALQASGGGVIAYLRGMRHPWETIKNLWPMFTTAGKTALTSVKDFSKGSLSAIMNFGETALSVTRRSIQTGVRFAAVSGGGLMGIFAGVKAALLTLSAPILSALAPIGTAIAAIGWPILALVAAVAGAAYLIYKNWEPISAFFVSLWGEIMDAFAPALETLKEAWGDLTEAFESILPVLKVVLGVAFAPLIAAGWVLLQLFRGVVQVIAFIARGVAGLVRAFTYVVKMGSNLIGGFFQWIIDTATAVWDSLTSILPEWLVGKKDKKVSISVDEKNKSASGVNSIRAIGSSPVVLASSGGMGMAPIALMQPVGGSGGGMSGGILPPIYGQSSGGGASSFVPPALSSPGESSSQTVFNSSPTINIYATPSQTSSDIAEVVISTLTRKWREMIGGSLFDVAARV